MSGIRVRIAPSPTGPLHLGTARTALFNYLFARHTGGTFILRLEDTDIERSSLSAEEDILDGLTWLGLDWDEGPAWAENPGYGNTGPYRQSERLARYEEAIDYLLAQNLAYYCYCTPEELGAEHERQKEAGELLRYNGRCANLSGAQRIAFEQAGRQPAVRFRVPTDRQIVVDDLIRGPVAFDSNLLGGDLVLQRSDGSPLYHFTVAVDDAAMQISHVIRGEDHLSNTPKHLLLFEALGYPAPQFAHLPLILNPDRSKMTKRKSQTAVADYRAQGFIPEALNNYLVLLGWSTGTEEEMLSLPEMIERFELERVNSAGAVFDLNRLLKFNGQWIRRLDPNDLTERLFPFLTQAREAEQIDWLPSGPELLALSPILQERLPTLAAVTETVGFLFREAVDPPLAALTSKNWNQTAARAGLAAARQTILALNPVDFEVTTLEGAFHQLTAREGWQVGDLFMVIRVALTGRTATPPLFETMVALGYERTLSRLTRALERLS